MPHRATSRMNEKSQRGQTKGEDQYTRESKNEKLNHAAWNMSCCSSVCGVFARHSDMHVEVHNYIKYTIKTKSQCITTFI